MLISVFLHSQNSTEENDNPHFRQRGWRGFPINIFDIKDLQVPRGIGRVIKA